MKYRWTIIGVVCLLVIGRIWLYEHDKVVRAQAEIAAVSDSARRELTSLDSMRVLDAKKDDENRALMAKLAQQQRKDSVAQVRTQTNTDSLIASAESKASDSVRAVIQLANESFERERVSFRSQIQDYATANAQLTAQVASKDSIITRQATALADLNTKLAHVITIGRPSGFQKVISAIPYIAGGYLLGKAL